MLQRMQTMRVVQFLTSDQTLVASENESVQAALAYEMTGHVSSLSTLSVWVTLQHCETARLTTTLQRPYVHSRRISDKLHSSSSIMLIVSRASPVLLLFIANAAAAAVVLNSACRINRILVCFLPKCWYVPLYVCVWADVTLQCNRHSCLPLRGTSSLVVHKWRRLVDNLDLYTYFLVLISAWHRIHLAWRVFCLFKLNIEYILLCRFWRWWHYFNS